MRVNYLWHLHALSFQPRLSGNALFFPYSFPPFVSAGGSVIMAGRVGAKGGGSLKFEGPAAGTTLSFRRLRLVPSVFPGVCFLASADRDLPIAKRRAKKALEVDACVDLSRINSGHEGGNDNDRTHTPGLRAPLSFVAFEIWIPRVLSWPALDRHCTPHILRTYAPDELHFSSKELKDPCMPPQGAHSDQEALASVWVP
jgi:hypothetical protein